MNGTNDLADAELAWTSLDKSVKIYKLHHFSAGYDKTKKIHPTQKPIALYRWILKNYTETDQIIIDTHSGSGSCAIACVWEGYDFIAIEKDKDYHKDSCERLQKQIEMFNMGFGSKL